MNLTKGHPQSSNLELTEGSDRGDMPRFRVQFRTIASSMSTVIEQEGLAFDLSLRGCRVEAPIALPKFLLMELRIYVPDLDWPIMVDGAVVQCVKGFIFSLFFVRLRQTEEERLMKVIDGMGEGSK
jgi:hypothetical protein